jgi:amino acid adenylation domain-containing protein
MTIESRTLLPLEAEELSSVKRVLLRQRLEAVTEAREVRIHPRKPGTPVPVSAEQRRVWLHSSAHPELPLYNEPFTIHRRGSFDPGVLKRTLNEIVTRHEGWRTSISTDGRAVIHASVPIALPFTDLNHLPEAQREAEALRIATADAQKPIRTDAVPLFRVQVVRMEPDYHRIYFTAHHIIFDGTSIVRILVPELAEIYAAFEADKSSSLPPPVLQYGDYAVWREQQAEFAVNKHLPFWLKNLSGELPMLRLPRDKPGTATTDHGGSMECFQIPGRLVNELRRLSLERGATLYMTLLAAFSVLLFRYSGQGDILVGSVADARRRPELENILGYILDTFALRSRPSGELSFLQFLTETRKSLLEALNAADVPFERIVQGINPKRSTRHHPVFQAFFTMRPSMPTFPEGWRLTQMDVTVDASKFLLYLDVCERPDHVEARFLYCNAVWQAETIRRMSAHWLVLLESICRHPERSLGQLSLLTQEEVASHFEAGGWNDTQRAMPLKTVDALFEQQARLTPHAVAAVFGQKSWTYADLDSRAEAIASKLRNVGVKTGSIVAILLERSLDLLAGLIAVLKTGAAYLPIDPSSPDRAIEDALANAETSVILTQTLMRHRVEANERVLVAVDESLEEQASNVNSTSMGDEFGRDLLDSAYVIYTSGTTGRPKGVEVSHSSLTNLLTSMQAFPGFDRQDVLLALTPISFDIAALELFLPLISGGTVVIASRAEARDPYQLADAINRSGCTIVQATPATWRSLVASGWTQCGQVTEKARGKALKVLCGGEPLRPELARSLLAAGVELWNMYGPTETTIWSLVHRVDSVNRDSTNVSIGLPIANTQAYILDERLQLTPVGVPGELFLGGAGLARGYRGNPVDTQKRFLKIDGMGGRRLYRTGDVAVRKADGTIEVHGRTDNQVKVRGYRIELEAIEAAVLQHPAVESAAARTWPEPDGNRRLSVYIVARDGFPVPSIGELRIFMEGTLPDYVIPSDVIALSMLPLTVHGKVDRSQLPSPYRKETISTVTAGSSDEETRITAIWKDILGRNDIGANDNFFDLGGHSLLVAALQQRILEQFDQRVAFAELYYNPTVRQQAKYLIRPSKPESTLPAGVLALQNQGNRTPIFWVHYLNRELVNAMGKSHPFFVLSMTPAELDAAGGATTLESLAASHVRKILATHVEGPYIVGGQCVGGALAYEIARQLRRLRKEVALLVLLDVPNLSSVRSCDTLGAKLNYTRYLVRRVSEAGLWKSWHYCKELARNSVARTLARRSTPMEINIAQHIIEAAARLYVPETYEGKVLLILASNRPPHRDFHPGWQSVVTQGLHTQHIQAHHRELLEPQHARNIADAVTRLIGERDRDRIVE